MSSSAKKFLGLIIVLVCAALPFLTQAPNPHVSSEPQATTARDVTSTLPRLKPAKQIKQEVKVVADKVAPVSSAPQPFANVPTIAAYRQDVEKDHHSTPRVLDNFAREMANEMNRAKQSLQYGVRFFKRLSHCATDASPESLETVRSVCAQNASRLAKMYPKALGPEYKRMHAGLDRRVRAALWR